MVAYSEEIHITEYSNTPHESTSRNSTINLVSCMLRDGLVCCEGDDGVQISVVDHTGIRVFFKCSNIEVKVGVSQPWGMA